MKNLLAITIVLASVEVFPTVAAAVPHLTQWQFERHISQICPQDYFPDGEPPDVPLREKDALTEFQNFLSDSGWTTNQLVEALMLAFTNHAKVVRLSDEYSRDVAGVAGASQCEINIPSVTNFLRTCIDDDSLGYRGMCILGVFPYTNLEPEVMDYMKMLCVRTNIYDGVATGVMRDWIAE